MTFKRLSRRSKILVLVTFLATIGSLSYVTWVHAATTLDSCCLLGGASGATAGAVVFDSTAVLDNTQTPPVFSVVGAKAPGTGGYFVHNEPTCSTTVNYGRFYVFLTTAVTWGSAVTETGAVTPALAWCNGTTWTVVGK